MAISLMNSMISFFFPRMKSDLYSSDGPTGPPSNVVPVAVVTPGKSFSKLGYMLSNVWLWFFWVDTDLLIVVAFVGLVRVVGVNASSAAGVAVPLPLCPALRWLSVEAGSATKRVGFARVRRERGVGA